MISKLSITAILALQYSPSLLKAIYGLVSGDPKAVADVGLKWTEKRLEKWAKDREKKQKVEQIHREILAELAEMPELWIHKDKLSAAQALAANTFEASFSFDSLFDCLDQALDIPRAWMAKGQVNREGQVMSDAIDADTLSLHDLILRTTATSLFRHFEELPDFQSWFLRRVRKEVQETRKLRKVVEAFLSDNSQADLKYELQYLDSVQRKFDVVELFIERPDLHEESEKQKLSVAYVTLDLSSQEGLGTTSRTVSASSLLDTLPDGPRRVLCLGPAGSGKTTLMRWMGIEAARPRDSSAMKIVRPEGENWRDRVPFLIRLRQFKDGPWPSPSVFHEQGIDLHAPPHGWAERILADGRGMLLIDGLDELRPERRKAAIAWIKELVEGFPDQTVVAVTSRPQAITPGILSSAGFQEFAVRDLSPSAQKTFVDQWHAAVALSFQNSREKLGKLEEKRLKILATLENEREISVLARNPLLCALMCALNRVYRTDLPKNLPDLCASACKMLLWDRDILAEVSSNNFLTKYAELTFSRRLQLAQGLAYDVVKGEANAITRETALEIIQAEMHLQGVGAQEISEEVLKGIVERSNLLRDAGDDEFEFAHNTLRDYLASTTLVRRREKSIILKGLRGAEFARWEPVACFTASSETNPGFGIELLTGLLKPPRADRPMPAWQEVFALKLNGHLVGFIPPEIRSKLAEIESRFLPVNSPERARNLAAAGQAAVEHLSYRSGVDEGTAAAMVEALGRIEAATAKEALEVWLTTDRRPMVLDSLAQSVGYGALAEQVNLLSVPVVFRDVTGQEGQTPGWAPYLDDISPLRDYPELTKLGFGDANISDLTPLSGLHSLTSLFLDGTAIHDLNPLRRLTKLEQLYIARTLVVDISPLAKLLNLRILSIFETDITDLSLLKNHKTLGTLYINRNQLSPTSLSAFQRDHPNCAIEYMQKVEELDQGSKRGI